MHTPSFVPHLRPENLQSLLNINERLLASRSNRCTEDQLGRELPILGDVPCIGDLLVDQRVVVLQVGAKPLLLKSSPDGVLVHSVGVRGPYWEFIGVQCELLLHAGDGGAVNEEKNL